MRIYTPTSRGEEAPPEESSITEWARRVTRELRERRVVSFETAEKVRIVVSLSKRDFAQRLGVDPRTLNRFKERGELSPPASDRAYRIARLIEAATRLHDGDEVRAVRWLKTPNRALGDRRPIDMVESEADFERVMGLIGALEEGVFV